MASAWGKAVQAQCKQVSGAIDQQVKAVEQAEREEKASSLRLVSQGAASGSWNR